MALTVVPESKSTGQIFANQLATGLGSELGQAAGKGIGAGLGALGTGLGQMTGLIEKPKQLTEDMLIKAGFTPEDARLIVNAPPALQAKLIDAISQREPAGPSQHEIYQQTGQPQQLPQEGQPEQESVMPGEEGATAPDRVIKTHPAVQSAMDKVASKSMNKPVETRPSALFLPKKEGLEDKRVRIAEEGLAFKKGEAERKHKTEMTKEERIEQHRIDQSTEKFYDKIKDKAKADKDNFKEIIEMNELNKTGKVISPGKAAALTAIEKGIWGFGFNLWGMTSPETQEYKKRSAGFVKGAKALFGSRVTEKEIEFFMDTVPTVLNSPEGRDRIGKIYEAMMKASASEEIAMEEIIAENGGRRPRDLRRLTEERAEKIFNEASNEFNQLISTGKSEVGQAEQKGTSDIITQLSAVRDASKEPEGMIAKSGGNPVARVVNGKWQPI